MAAQENAIELKGPAKGEPRSVHGLARGRKVRNIAITVVGWMLSAGFGSAGVAFWLLAYTEYGPAVVWRWSLPWFALAMISLPLALFGTGALWRNRNLHFYLFEDGFVFTRGRTRVGARWSEVQGLLVTAVRYGFLGVSWGQRIRLQLDLVDGRQLEVNEPLEDEEALVDEIKSHIYPDMLEAYRAAFNDGHPIVFGPITLNRSGIRTDRNAIAWSQFESAELQTGTLTIQPHSESGARRIKVAAENVPNVDLCVQLIQALGQRT